MAEINRDDLAIDIVVQVTVALKMTQGDENTDVYVTLYRQRQLAQALGDALVGNKVTVTNGSRTGSQHAEYEVMGWMDRRG